MKYVVGTCPECGTVVGGTSDRGSEMIGEMMDAGLLVGLVETSTVFINSCPDTCNRARRNKDTKGVEYEDSNKV